MGAWITFRFATPDYRANDPVCRREKTVVVDNIFDLFDLEPGYMKKQQVYACFVREFQLGQKYGTLKNLFANKEGMPGVKKTLQHLYKKYIQRDEMAWMAQTWRGPSDPFPAMELTKWANTWMRLLRGMTEEERDSVLGENTVLYGSILSDLDELAHFGTRAAQQHVRLVLEMRY